MPSDDLGVPHIAIGAEPPDDQRIQSAWVLVAVTSTGGEGVYSQTVGKYMYNFIATEPEMKDTLEDYLRARGSIEVARKQGIRLEWRRMAWDCTAAEIT